VFVRAAMFVVWVLYKEYKITIITNGKKRGELKEPTFIITQIASNRIYPVIARIVSV
jgi:hypothetical protein